MRVFEIVDNAVRSITILKSDKISKKKTNQNSTKMQFLRNCYGYMETEHNDINT